MTRPTDKLLDHLEIKSPCEADWDSMQGNDRVRFCGHCRLTVRDVSDLTTRQALELVHKSQGRLCLRIRPDAPAHAETSKPPEPLFKINRRAPRIAAGTFGAALGLYAGIGAQAQTPSVTDATTAAATIQKREAMRDEPRGGGNASLVGTAFDPQRAVVPSVSVTLVNEQTGVTRNTKTDDVGEYSFDSLEAGSYTLRIEGGGFAMSETRSLTLSDGSVQRAVATLEPQLTVMGVMAISVEPSDPLVKAAYENDLTAVKRLLAAGLADVNAVDKDLGINALAQAYTNNNRDIVLELLRAGADVNRRLQYKQTVLMRLSGESSVELTRELLEAGAKVNRRDEEGNTALMFAASWGSVEVVKALLEAGAKIDAKNQEGRTALMKAAESNSLENVRALILAGATLDLKDKSGSTALERGRYYDEVTQLLRAFGAKDVEAKPEETEEGEP
jgi:hypothetical protein